MAAKRKGRSVLDLYNDAELIAQPKVPPQTEKRLGKHFTRQKPQTRPESGTCNVCSTPCSSCMHLKLAQMGSKEEEFSDETCRVSAASQYSNNDANALSSLNKVCYSSLHTTSEASNLISANSSHDSLSENAESKANIRSSDIPDTSAESDVLPKLSSGGTLVEDRHSPNLIRDQRPSSNKHEDPSGEEGHADSVSCVSGADDVCKAATSHNKNLERKDILCSSNLISGLGLEGSKLTLPSKLDAPDDADAGSGSPKSRSGYPPSDENGNSHDNVKEVECSMENNNPSPSKEGASNIVCIDNLATQNSADDASKVLNKKRPKLELKVDKDIGDEMDEGIKCSDLVEKDKKPNELVELPDVQEPLHCASGDESDESEILEHDVKVCDICGDAGREDLLAVCSRCTDGAEHTYCMKEMLRKVPEGEWLCEECKMADENETPKQDNEEKRVNKASSQSLGKRYAETIEVALASKRQAVETSLGSPKPSSSPSRTVALSRDSSFKSSEKGKVKQVHQTSVGNQSASDIPEIARSSLGPRLKSPKGTLLKSNSFSTINSKPKVKLVDGVPQKHKGSRESSSLDMKEEPARMIRKSMSFKSSSSGHPSATEPRVKTLPTNFSHVQDTRGLKQVKDRGSFERKKLTKVDRPLGSSGMTSSSASTPKGDQKLTPRGESLTVSSTNNSRELKADGKFGALSRSSSSLGRKVAEVPVTSVRAPSTNGSASASFDQKFNQVSPKDEPSSSSCWTAEIFCNNGNETLPDVLPRSRESSNQEEKSREISASRLRPASATGSKNVTCQHCKETGHIADYCTIVSPRASCTEITTARSARDEMSKGNKLKAAIEAAMLKKPGICRKKKESDQSDGLSSLNMDVSSEIPSQDKFTVLDKMNEEAQGQVDVGTCSLKQPQVCPTDTPFKVGDLDPVLPSIGKLIHAPAAISIPMKMVAIPEHEFIWLGGFEVRRVGKLMDLYGGIQAHLSTCASPKVLDVVNKFPPKITLDEVPRLSTWPRQFEIGGAREDNIALYFFAKDLESYTKDYKGLLDSMIKKDLALKGSFDGVELLIFPSTQLPDNSQRWNMLFFFWGVFRGRRSEFSDCLKKIPLPSLNMVPPGREIQTGAMSTDNICLSDRTDEEKSASNTCGVSVRSDAPEKSYSSLYVDHDKKAPRLWTNSDKQGDGLDSKPLSKSSTSSALLYPESSCASLPLEKPTPQQCRVGMELEPSTEACGASSGSNGNLETPVHIGASHAGEDASSLKIFPVGSEGLGVRGSLSDEKIVDRMYSDRDKVKLCRDLNEDDMDVDIETSFERSPKKRPFLDPSETVSVTSSYISQEMPWNKVDSAVLDAGNFSKKPKIGFGELYGGGRSLRDGNPLSSGGFDSQACNLGSSSRIKEKSCDKTSDEKIILEDLAAKERYFFPVGSQRIPDFQLGSNSMPWKGNSSIDEDQFQDGFPDLELALGAEKKNSNKVELPFFIGMEKNSNQNKPPDKVMEKGAEDSVAASLSLSLSFPFPEKEETVKPVSKTEQLTPERRHLNTSLLLFGGLPKK